MRRVPLLGIAIAVELPRREGLIGGLSGHDWAGD
jgi:hypothetical protein